MGFTFETQYNTKTMTVMAKVLRKTIRKKRSRRAHIFGWSISILGLLLTVLGGFSLDFRTIITLSAILVIVITLLFEDNINGYIATKRLLSGTEKAVTVFSEGSFLSTTDIGKTEWNYDKIALIAETSDFLVFIFDSNHAQLYDKRHLQNGTIHDFRRFIETATGKQIQPIA